MTASDLNEQIIETLYAEALLLADEARGVFDLRNLPEEGCDDQLRIALSIEGLRTTTRVMHMLAWLLNQRAYFSGDMSESQLHNHGQLPDQRPSDTAQMALLEPETRALIRDTERLHARIERIDRDWRAGLLADDTPVQAMQGRIAEAFARGNQAAASARA